MFQGLRSSFWSGSKQQEIYNDPNNHRKQFDENLKDPRIIENANPTTVATVRTMSDQMGREGVPMTQEHCAKATASIQRADNLPKFLAHENPDVIAARQTTPVSLCKPAYSMGQVAHEFVSRRHDKFESDGTPYKDPWS